MRVVLTEPMEFQYLNLNKETNTYHVFMPLLILEEIGTFSRNSWNGFGGVKEFFGISENPQQITLFNELTSLKEKLEFDIHLMDLNGVETELKTEKIERLNQINAHIALIETFNTKWKEDPKLLTSTLKTLLGEYETAILSTAGNLDVFVQYDLEEATKLPGKYVTKNGWICTDFCEFMATIENSFFIQSQRRDFALLPREIPSLTTENPELIELDPSSLTDEQLSLILSKASFETWVEISHSHPERLIAEQQSYFLKAVAYGQQNVVDLLLKDNPHAQKLLTTAATFTDYSGRTFHCTAYEYAYWAKDTRMCRMLEGHIDKNEDTKTMIFECVKKIEGIDALPGEPKGLPYQQNGIQHRSSHFDIMPTIKALENYMDAYDRWHARTINDWSDRSQQDAWLEVGKTQCDLPAHYAQEICDKGRSFATLPSFNVDKDDIPKETLSRSFEFYNCETGRNDAWFPLKESSGLGTRMGIIRRSYDIPNGTKSHIYQGMLDRDALRHLDEVRTADTILSQEHLKPIPPALMVSI